MFLECNWKTTTKGKESNSTWGIWWNAINDTEYVMDKRKRECSVIYYEESYANHDFDSIFYDDGKTRYWNLSTDLHLQNIPRPFSRSSQLREVVSHLYCKKWKSCKWCYWSLAESKASKDYPQSSYFSYFQRASKTEYSQIYSTRVQSIPFPNMAKNDPRIPLSSRFVLLLSYVGKMCSGLFCNRLKYFLEVNEILSEEQNGFSKGWSSIGHIFSLITVCKNRWIECKEMLYGSWIYRKHLVLWIELAFFRRLLEIRITRKLCSDIESCYNHTTSRV